jgi:hypothetical protein
MSGTSLAKHLGCLAFLMAACGPAKVPEKLFYGECQVEVQADHKDAYVLIDNIKVGKGSAQVEIPCGERDIRVMKPGYVPFQEYRVVSKGEPLKVDVKLQSPKSYPDFALSKELLDQAEQGRKIRDPWKNAPTEAELKAEADELQKTRDELVAKAKAQEEAAKAELSATSAGGTQADGAAAPTAAFSTNVDDWR